MPRSGGVMVVVVALMVAYTATAQEATTPCPMIKCAPDCVSDIGPNGCPQCACPKTCQDVNCTVYEDCVLEQFQCFRAPCFPIPTCVPKSEATTPCPMIKCAPDCVPDIGPNGCQRCACPKTCSDVNCTNNQDCTLRQVQCFRAPCFPIPTCVPKSEITTPAISDSTRPKCESEIICGTGCQKLLGSNGCPYCDCPATCEVTDCRDGYICKMQELPCLVKPCPIRPRCVLNDPCAGTPNTKSCGRIPTPGLWVWFFNSSANACQRFRYYGCTPSPNTFLFRTICEDKCKRRDPPICPAIACAESCYRLNRKNKCPRCICPNPCKNFKCSADKVCQLRETTCDTDTCRPERYCAQKSCPTQPPCGIRCMNGLKTDKNGCQLCECL